jgi:hypothetical protein
MRIAGALVALGGPRLIVRMSSVVVAIGVLVMMPECHALSCYDRRHALGRNGQRQQENRKKSEDGSRHRQAL